MLPDSPERTAWNGFEPLDHLGIDSLDVGVHRFETEPEEACWPAVLDAANRWAGPYTLKPVTMKAEKPMYSRLGLALISLFFAALLGLSLATWMRIRDGEARPRVEEHPPTHEGQPPHVPGASWDQSLMASMGLEDGGSPQAIHATHLGPFDGTLLRYAGEPDLRNHYSSAVMLTTGNPEKGAQCSGVLLSPRVVLTAGSCVCKPKQSASDTSEERVIDSSACEKRATVMTVKYGKVYDKYSAEMEVQEYTGAIFPHPEFHIRLDAKSSVVTSHADLALIRLESPVEDVSAPVSLADSEVVAGEYLIMTGYGHDEHVEQAFGERYFRRNRVLQPASAEDERFSYVPLSVDTHTNHGGWPCLRETGEGRWLVGISGRSSVEDPTCVSISVYGKWLRTEVKRLSFSGREEK
ncbi:MAG TPA: trypsin-like serine protease [Myxococcaceae bacterium]|jgi:hypothetical protein